jgi:ATP phosphoribosyltransferase
MRIGVAADDGPPPAELVDLFEAAGLPAASLRRAASPALVPAGDVTWLLAGAVDVLRACDHGGLDLGIVGRDRLLEGRRGTGELLDLRCGRDQLVVAAHAASRQGRRPRVATRYPATASRHYAAAGRQPELLVMDEPALAPALGLADEVVELVSRLATAPTAEALVVRATIADCSARLVAGRAARVLLGTSIGALVERLRTALEER